MLLETQQLTAERVSSKEKIQSLVAGNWFVIYTCPRTEKLVYHELIQRGYEVFLPTIKTLRIWKNRQKKLIDLVLFPNYIFVKTYESELYKIKQLPKIVTFIHCQGKPSILSLKDIEWIKKIISLNQTVVFEKKFCKGDKVRIAYGPLAGLEGILIKQKGKTRFGFQIKEINQTMFIEVSTEILESSANK